MQRIFDLLLAVARQRFLELDQLGVLGVLDKSLLLFIP